MPAKAGKIDGKNGKSLGVGISLAHSMGPACKKSIIPTVLIVFERRGQSLQYGFSEFHIILGMCRVFALFEDGAGKVNDAPEVNRGN